MSLLLKLLLQRALRCAFVYLCPNAGPEDEPVTEEVAEEADPIEAATEGDEPAVEPTEDDPEPEPASRPVPRANREIIALRERSQRLEREIEDIRARQPAPPSPIQRQIEEEERILAQPETEDNKWQRWQAHVNRTQRQNEQATHAALRQAADDRDAAAYERQASKNPLFDKYRTRVEDRLVEARKQGANPNREFILKVLIGEDQLAGNLKSTKAPVKTVARGKPVAARSDVPRKGGSTEQQKRYARLQDQPI